MANCLFCSSDIPPTFKIVNGTVTKVKSGFTLSLGTETSEDSAVHGQLNTFFVLKRILNLPIEILSELLSLCNGESYPEHWIGACQSCDELVTQFYGVAKEISKLEGCLARIGNELKGKIGRSEDVAGASPIWKRIRKEVLNPKESSTTSAQQVQADATTEPDDDKNRKIDDTSSEKALRRPPPVLIDLCSDTEDDEENVRSSGHESQSAASKDLTEKSSTSVLVPANVENNLRPPINTMEAGQDNQEAQIEGDLEVVLVTPVYSFHPPAFGHSHQKRKSTPSKKAGKVNPSVSMIPTKGKPRNKTSSQRKWTKDNPYFVCHLCKYSTKLVKKLEDHLKLHDENSGYITCTRPKCNTLVLERKLLKHYQLKHSAPATGKIANSDLQKLCEKCGEFYTNITRHRRQCKVDTKTGEESGPKEQDNSNPGSGFCFY